VTWAQEQRLPCVAPDGRDGTGLSSYNISLYRLQQQQHEQLQPQLPAEKPNGLVP
jgi:hypothetical protein